MLAVLLVALDQVGQVFRLRLTLGAYGRAGRGIGNAVQRPQMVDDHSQRVIRGSVRTLSTSVQHQWRTIIQQGRRSIGCRVGCGLAELVYTQHVDL